MGGGRQAVPTGAPPAVGRDAIREGIKVIQQMSPQLELRTTDVLVEGNVAIKTGTWSVKLEAPDGAVEDRGPAVRIWRRGPDGMWRLYRDIWNSERPPAS
jgi:ketosteroid isomerase-like protein